MSGSSRRPRPPRLGRGVRALATTAIAAALVVGTLAVIKGVSRPARMATSPALGGGTATARPMGVAKLDARREPTLELARGPSLAEVVARRQAKLGSGHAGQRDSAVKEPEVAARPVRGRVGRAARRPVTETEPEPEELPPLRQLTPAAPAPSAPQAAAGDDDQRIDALVGKALAGPPTEEPQPAATAEVAAPSLGRTEIETTMKLLSPQVRKQCPLGEPANVLVRVEVGPAGEVLSAVAEGALAGKPVATCVETLVKTARFPASAGSSFRYPLPLR